MPYEQRAVNNTAVIKAVAAASGSPLKTHPAVHPFQRYAMDASKIPNNAGVIQRVMIKTGMSDLGDTKDYNIPDEKIVSALYKKFYDYSKQDYPKTPFIENKPNEGRSNWDEESALGDRHTLGDTPLNDFWQIAMNFKKSRNQGIINIESKDGDKLSSAIYNQYGKTQINPGNADVMVYKYPEEKDKKETAESDKGVSYKLAIAKFKEISRATKLKDGEIAAHILDFYKDGKMPDLIKKRGQQQNFGYLTTLMVLPETVRSVGTFPFGLIMLDNIVNGVKAEEAFQANKETIAEVKKRASLRKKKSKKDTEEKEENLSDEDVVSDEDVIEPTEEKEDETGTTKAYQDKIDVGGLYPPAYAGSKKPLNDMEERIGKGRELKAYPNENNKGQYYWNITLKRFGDMLQQFASNHGELLLFDDKIDDQESAIDEVVSRIIDHFKIGQEITGKTTVKRELGRAMNKGLFDINTTMKSVNKPELLFSGTNVSKSAFTLVSGNKNEDEQKMTTSFLESQTRNNSLIGNNLDDHRITPDSPTHYWGDMNSEIGSFLIDDRTERKQDDKGIYDKMPGSIDQVRNFVGQQKISREISKFSLNKSGDDTFDKKRKMETIGEKQDIDNADVKKKKPTPLPVRKMDLVSDIQQMVNGMIRLGVLSEWTRGTIEKSIDENTVFWEFVQQRLNVDTEIKLSKDEVWNIVTQQLNMMGISNEVEMK